GASVGVSGAYRDPRMPAFPASGDRFRQRKRVHQSTSAEILRAEQYNLHSAEALPKERQLLCGAEELLGDTASCWLSPVRHRGRTGAAKSALQGAGSVYQLLSANDEAERAREKRQ